MGDSYSSKDKTTKDRSRSSRTPRARQSSRVESSPTGVTLRPEGSNFLQWHEALSNHFLKEFTPHGQLLKNNGYIESPGPVRTAAQWTAIRTENGLDAEGLSNLKEKFAERRVAAKDKMLADRFAMYGIARSSISHSILERLPTIEGFAPIHTAGDQ